MQFSLPVLLFIALVVLKLTDVIEWSWWWVTSPLWITGGISLVMFVLFGLFFAIGNKNFR